jgi:hypothetical protein
MLPTEWICGLEIVAGSKGKYGDGEWRSQKWAQSGTEFVFFCLTGNSKRREMSNPLATVHRSSLSV